jgi:hypothetical protein
MKPSAPPHSHLSHLSKEDAMPLLRVMEWCPMHKEYLNASTYHWNSVTKEVSRLVERDAEGDLKASIATMSEAPTLAEAREYVRKLNSPLDGYVVVEETTF